MKRRLVGCWVVLAVVGLGCGARRSPVASRQEGPSGDACGGWGPRRCALEGKSLLGSSRVKGLAMLEAACRGGDVIACDDSAIDFKDEPRRAFELTEHGCEVLKENVACRNLGVYFQYGKGVGADRQKADDLYQRGCERGDALACRYQGNLKSQGEAGRAELEAAARAFTQGCSARDAMSCSSFIGVTDRLNYPIQPEVRVGILQRSCADRNGWGCYLLGHHQRSIGSPDATASFQRGCEWDDASSCDELAVALWRGGKKDASIQAATRSCRLDEKLGCWRRGLMAAADRNFGFASQTWVASCARGDGRSCRSLGQLHLHGEGVPLDGELARGFFQKSCDLKLAEGCSLLGWQLGSGTLIKKDPVAALAAMEQGCALGKCLELGLAQSEGRLVPKDLTKALRTYEKGCGLGDAGSCTNASDMHSKKQGGGEPDKAAAFALKGCDAGGPIACCNLAEYLVEGRGIQRDSARALALWETTAQKEPYALVSFGEWREKGWPGAPPDKAQALALFTRACERGVEPGCAAVARLTRTRRAPAAKALVAPAAPASAKDTPQQLALPDFSRLLSGF